MREMWSGSLLLWVAETIPAGCLSAMVSIAPITASWAVKGNLLKKTDRVVWVPEIPGSSVSPQFPLRTLVSQLVYWAHTGTRQLGWRAENAWKEGQELVATPRDWASASFAASFIRGVM